MANQIKFDSFSEELSTEVLVIGAGGAGLRASMEASDNYAKVIVVCEGRFTKTGSTFFHLAPRWGIQFLPDGSSKADSDYFLKEILEVGEGMASPTLAKVLINETPSRVYELEKMGIEFQKVNGNFYDSLCCFARVKRKVAAAVNLENVRNIFEREIKKRSITVIEGLKIIRVLVKDVKSKNVVCGVIGVNSDGDLVLIKCKSIIIATGGGAAIFKNNLNSPELVGDGYELALDAGASLINMEYLQYIYGIVSPKKLLFSEKVINYNPPILNKNRQEFIRKYIPDGLSLEDIVKARVEHGPFTSRLISKYYDIAIYSEIRNGNGTYNNAVYIDLKKLSENISEIEKEFPGVEKWFKWIRIKGIDLEKQLLEIRLCAHACNGGIKVNSETMSEVGGLFACGEVMGGSHGADRQGGNMIAATQVFGKKAGENAAIYSKEVDRIKLDRKKLILEMNNRIKLIKDGNLSYKKLREEIQNIVNQELVICRNEKGLRKVIDYLNSKLSEKISKIKLGNKKDGKNYFTLKSMINTALIIANSALLRRESRGAHHREDYLDKDDKNYRKVIEVKRNINNIYRFIDPLV